MPEFLLKRWADPVTRRLWRSKRTSSGTFHQKAVAPRETGYQTDLYTMKREVSLWPGEREDVVEQKFFGAVDSGAARSMVRMLDVGPGQLTDDERAAWALFLNAMLERHPAVLDPRDSRAGAIADEVVAEFMSRCSTPESRANAERALSLCNTTAMAQNAIRSHMINETRDAEVVSYLKSLQWLIVPVSQQSSFELVTSDRPLVVNFGNDHLPIVTLSLPLGPKHLFFAQDPSLDMLAEFSDEVALFTRQQVLVMKAAHGVIYSRQRLEGAMERIASECLGCVSPAPDADTE